jgi:galactofuranose transport system permease protein
VSQAQIQPQPTAAAAPARGDTYALIMRYSTLGALILLIVFNVLFTRNFVSWRVLDVNLTQVAATVIVGVGMTLVIATGGIDLSVGSLMAISGAIAPIIFMNKVFHIGEIHVAVAVAMIVGILLAGAFGWFNGWLITRFRIQPIIATLVLFIAGRGIAQVMTNGDLQPFKLDTFQWVGLGRVFEPQGSAWGGFRGIPDQVVIMLILVFAAAWMLKRSVFGRQILAIGGNERAARLAGVPVASVKRWVYCISGLCAGLAGLVVIAINSSSDANQVGLNAELDAIAAVAVGGTLLSGGRATVVGTLIGALIIQLVRYTMLANGIPDDVAQLAKAALIIAAVWLQSQGRN